MFWGVGPLSLLHIRRLTVRISPGGGRTLLKTRAPEPPLHRRDGFNSFTLRNLRTEAGSNADADMDLIRHRHCSHFTRLFYI